VLERVGFVLEQGYLLRQERITPSQLVGAALVALPEALIPALLGLILFLAPLLQQVAVLVLPLAHQLLAVMVVPAVAAVGVVLEEVATLPALAHHKAQMVARQ
jgi:hypothetical protein